MFSTILLIPMGRVKTRTNKSPSVAKLRSAFPYLFFIFLIEFIVLNNLLKEIAFLFLPIRGREICYTADRQAGRQPRYGFCSEVALAKKRTRGHSRRCTYFEIKCTCEDLPKASDWRRGGHSLRCINSQSK